MTAEKARTVLLVHGMWGGGHEWRPWRELFERRGFRCLAPTLRHHDVDPADPPPPGLATTSLLEYAADLETQVLAEGGPVLAVGHSMGGLLVQKLAARGLVRAAVLLAPASPAGVLGLRPSVIRSFRRALLRWGFWRKPHRPTLAEATYSVLHRVPPPEREAIHGTFVWESGRAAAEIGLWLFDPNRASAVDPELVRCPLLHLAGVEDRITPVSVQRRTAARYGDRVTFRELEGHAHWLLAEPGWEEVAAAAAGWLSEAPVP